MAYCPQCFSEVLSRQGNWCNPCKAGLMRKNRLKYSELPGDEKQRSNARSQANAAQRRGRIKRLACQVCKNPRAQKHHNDYGKPLHIVWLCRRCHIMHHKREDRAAKIATLRRCLEVAKSA